MLSVRYDCLRGTLPSTEPPLILPSARQLSGRRRQLAALRLRAQALRGSCLLCAACAVCAFRGGLLVG